MSSLNVIFNLNATKKLVVLLEKLSKGLQTVEITAEYALSLFHQACNPTSSILSEAKKVSGAMESRSEVRQRKVPSWMDDGEMMLTEDFQVHQTISYKVH